MSQWILLFPLSWYMWAPADYNQCVQTNPALKWVSYWISRSLSSFTSFKDLFSCDWCENLLQTTQSWRPNWLSMLPWSLHFHLDKLFFFFQWPKLLIKHFYKSWFGLVTKSCLTLVTPWTVDHQAPLSMGFPRQEYWSGLPFPSPEDLSNPGIDSKSPALQADYLTTEPPGKSLPLLKCHQPPFRIGIYSQVNKLTLSNRCSWHWEYTDEHDKSLNLHEVTFQGERQMSEWINT